MDTANILSEGPDGIEKMKAQVIELEEAKKKVAELQELEEELEKQLRANEKAIADEVTATQKKRRNEIEASFDEQIDSLNTRIKKEQSKKEKEKDVGVTKRIEMETQDCQTERIRLKQEVKAAYQKNHIPQIFNNRLIYALYLPIGIKDFVIILLTLAITLLVIPVGIYKLMLPQTTVMLVIVYIITVIVFGSIYLAINKKLREEKSQAIREIRKLRIDLVKNQKEITEITRSIRKDKDESGYHLENFTKEIDNLRAQVQELMDAKKDAVVEFETTTIKVLETQIRSHKQAENEQLMLQKKEAVNEQKKNEQAIRQIALNIASQYETYLGKDMLTITNLDRMKEMIQSQEVSNIGEAIEKIRSER